MNCFQKLLSSWRGTTAFKVPIDVCLLWIAFKNYYLRDEEQQTITKGNPLRCCELLSKIIIFVTRNNLVQIWRNANPVVNCFQKLLSSWRGTTVHTSPSLGDMLWIAFKNYYLRDEEQLRHTITTKVTGCELLSKIIIFVTRNNTKFLIMPVRDVVNCFQKLLSSWRGTT